MDEPKSTFRDMSTHISTQSTAPIRIRVLFCCKFLTLSSKTNRASFKKQTTHTRASCACFHSSSHPACTCQCSHPILATQEFRHCSMHAWALHSVFEAPVHRRVPPPIPSPGHRNRPVPTVLQHTASHVAFSMKTSLTRSTTVPPHPTTSTPSVHSPKTHVVGRTMTKSTYGRRPWLPRPSDVAVSTALMRITAWDMGVDGGCVGRVGRT
ncbi:hypothetical protein EV363DRAFT_39200 [Boletus edulis]|nr:hypothetical protein EV363DRAFT_39200 [Boletus edulis]